MKENECPATVYVKIFSITIKGSENNPYFCSMKTPILADKALMMEEIRRLVSEGRTATITVRGNSMNPFLVDRRDKMTLGGFEDSEIKRGTVVLFKDSTGDYIIHRVVRRDGDDLTIKGDGNSKKVEKARVRDVIAVMHNIERKGCIYTPESRTWRVYSYIWMLLSPVRRILLGLWRRIFL